MGNAERPVSYWIVSILWRRCGVDSGWALGGGGGFCAAGFPRHPRIFLQFTAIRTT